MSFKRNIFQILIVAASITMVQACIYQREEPLPQPACTTPDTVSFKNDIIPILTVNCAISGCHTTPDPQSELNLSASVAYSQLLNPGPGYVVPGSLLESVMYSQITNPTQIMPPTGEMDNCTITMIKTWILQGAKNN